VGQNGHLGLHADGLEQRQHTAATPAGEGCTAQDVAAQKMPLFFCLDNVDVWLPQTQYDNGLKFHRPSDAVPVKKTMYQRIRY
jgi:hypothetical protein